MNKIEPNLNADILPKISGGGINLGISLDYFLDHTNHILINSKNYDSSLVNDKTWLIIEYNFLDVYGVAQTIFTAKWDKGQDIILRFDGKNDPKLDFITLQNNYKGKLFGKWGIGTTLKELDNRPLSKMAFERNSSWCKKHYFARRTITVSRLFDKLRANGRPTFSKKNLK
ncbi:MULTISPECIES: hypothetical protein [unclassified Acinetobacter]|uniref:hypothetical protein n=1 Tax=unclassified Acinetobacter TaxID=196816 RepID=UPI0035B7D1D6